MRTDILQQAQAIRASMDAAAIVLTDDQAAKAPRLYHTWAAGGTVVLQYLPHELVRHYFTEVT